MSTIGTDPVTDFMAGVAHGERVGAYREVGLRLELEGAARKRVRAAVAVERHRSRRFAVCSSIVTFVAAWNLAKHGLTW